MLGELDDTFCEGAVVNIDSSVTRNRVAGTILHAHVSDGFDGEKPKTDRNRLSC